MLEIFPPPHAQHWPYLKQGADQHEQLFAGYALCEKYTGDTLEITKTKTIKFLSIAACSQCATQNQLHPPSVPFARLMYISHLLGKKDVGKAIFNLRGKPDCELHINHL